VAASSRAESKEKTLRSISKLIVDERSDVGQLAFCLLFACLCVRSLWHPSISTTTIQSTSISTDPDSPVGHNSGGRIRRLRSMSYPLRFHFLFAPLIDATTTTATVTTASDSGDQVAQTDVCFRMDICCPLITHLSTRII
jgi:hypothetical protein